MVYQEPETTEQSYAPAGLRLQEMRTVDGEEDGMADGHTSKSKSKSKSGSLSKSNAMRIGVALHVTEDGGKKEKWKGKMGPGSNKEKWGQAHLMCRQKAQNDPKSRNESMVCFKH